MGKASKRMKRRKAAMDTKKAEKVAVDREETKTAEAAPATGEVREAEQKLDRAFGEKRYGEALDALAELVEKTKNLSPEHIFMGAKSYFELKDYDRAAQWVTNTLTFAPAHVEARLLLARICMMKNRAEDAMAILNLLLENGLASLSEAQQAAAKKIWLRYGERAFLAKFPNLSALDAAAQPARDEAESAQQAGEEAKSDVKDLLRRLKEKVSGKAVGTLAPTSLGAPEAPAASEAPVAHVAEPAPASPAPAETAAKEEAPVASDAAGVIAAVRGKAISRAEKLRILNAFAGAAYLADDCRTAEEYLGAALTLDAEDDATLKNAVYNSLALGEIQRAESYAARMHFADFAVLDEIKAAKGL